MAKQNENKPQQSSQSAEAQTIEQTGLIEQINTSAKALGIEAPSTDGLDAKQLGEALTSLRALEAERAAGGTQGTSGAAQTTTPGVEKGLPETKPDEIAPIPGMESASKAKLAPSASGYRVTPGKALTSAQGDLLDGGAEIGERDVPGGAERLQELEKAGYVTKVDQKGDESATKPAPGEQTPAEKNAELERKAAEELKKKERESFGGGQQ